MPNPFRLKKELRLFPGYLSSPPLDFSLRLFSSVWVLIASFSTTKEIFANKLLSSGFHFENYEKGLGELRCVHYFLLTPFSTLCFLFVYSSWFVLRRHTLCPVLSFSGIS